jgi:ribonuclease VapC
MTALANAAGIPLVADKARLVLDSFAVLAYLEDERGADRVRAALEAAKAKRADALLSEINLGEVLYITEREQGLPSAHKALATLEQLPIAFVPATRQRVLAAVHLKARHAMSYADCFAVALALEHEGIILTGDPKFKTVEAIASVEWI